MSWSVSSSGKKGRAGKRPSIVRHDVGTALRDVLPCALVFLAYFVVVMAVSTAAIPDISIFSLEYTHDQLKWRLWADAMTYPVVIGALVFGAAMAYFSFRFLLVKMQATTYLSLPISRSRLYITRAAVAVAGMLAVLLVACALSLVLNVIALKTWDGEFLAFAYVVIGLFACSLVGFSVGVVALLLAGTQLEAVLFSAALLACVSVVCWSLNALMDVLLVGNAAGEYLINTQKLVEQPLLQALSACNPLLFFVGPVTGQASFMVQHPVYAPAAPDWLIVVVWLVFAVVLGVVGHMLFVTRRGEKAGMAGLCTPMTFVFSFVCALAVFALVFQLLAGLNAAAGIVAGVVLFALVSLLLLRGPLKGETTTFRQTATVLGVEAGVLLLAVIVVATGALGWSGRVPQPAEVASVQVSYTGSPVYLAKGFDSASASNNSYYASATYSYVDEADISKITEVHGEVIATGHAPAATDRIDFGATVVPYDLLFTYTMKDGSVLTRYYDRATLAELAQLLALDDSESLSALRAVTVKADYSSLEGDAASQIASSMAAQAFANGDIFLANPLYEEPLQLTCTDEARQELLDALAADVAKQSAEDRYHPQKRCRGVLMFSNDGANDVEAFSYQMENSLVYLTDSFERTLKWLDEHDLTSTLGVSADSIVKMSFEYYDPFAGMNDATRTPHGQLFFGYMSETSDDFIAAPDFGRRFETDDRDQVEQVFKLARNTYYMDGGGYQVCCELENGKNVYLFVPYAIAPDWLIRQAQ